MKTEGITAAALAVSLVWSAAVWAQTASADGEVKKIDQAAGKITIRHGPMKAFDMEQPMTMVYRLKDPSVLGQVKVGDKVKFDVERANGQFTVTKIQKEKR